MFQPREFRYWLRGFRSDWIVGYPMNPRNSPLARFIKSRQDAPDRVRATSYKLQSGSHQRRLSKLDWETQFISELEYRYGDDPNQGITSRQAIWVLDDVLTKLIFDSKETHKNGKRSVQLRGRHS